MTAWLEAEDAWLAHDYCYHVHTLCLFPYINFINLGLVSKKGAGL